MLGGLDDLLLSLAFQAPVGLVCRMEIRTMMRRFLLTVYDVDAGEHRMIDVSFEVDKPAGVEELKAETVKWNPNARLISGVELAPPKQGFRVVKSDGIYIGLAWGGDDGEQSGD